MIPQDVTALFGEPRSHLRCRTEAASQMAWTSGEIAAKQTLEWRFTKGPCAAMRRLASDLTHS